MIKDTGKQLEKNDINELLNGFDEWLKSVKKISNYPNASYDRDKRKKQLGSYIKEIKQPTLMRIAEQIKAELISNEHDEVLQDIVEFFKDNFGIEIVSLDSGSRREEKVDTIKLDQTPTGVKSGIIGRVAPTIDTPATPTEFTFWAEDREDIHIEIGSLVTAKGENGVKVTGLISDIRAITDIQSVLDSYYAHAFGRASEDMPTRLPIVMSAKVEVVRRSDGRTEPIRGTWPVYFATAEEIRQAYGAEISSEHEVLAGFTYDDQHKPVPISFDARYVLGYEAAHVNISGASGVATKTSYALFLLYSLLAYSEKHNGSVAAIAFNVKEADLMFIDNLPEGWKDLEVWEKHGVYGQSIRLWKQARDDFGIDPIKWKKEKKFRFFAPQHFDPKGGVLSQRRKDVKAFNYSLRTLIKTGVGSLYTLFDVEDLDDKALAFIASMCEVAANPGDEESKRGGGERSFLTFEQLFMKVEQSLRGGKRDGIERSDWFNFGETTHHKSTAHKVLNRMKHAIDNQLKGLILKSENDDEPIPVDEIRPGELWVVDLTQLSDKGQRLVFQTIVRTVFKKLEERKSLEVTEQLSGELVRFPKHIVIFVDELNKFVPSGREYSALKGEIVEMAARGRSIGMSLIGAQQLASKVDEEVLANTSTFAVGRSHAVEIRKPPYAWLAEGLKEKAMILDKGWMLIWHCLHKRPVLINFPIPLHRIYEEIKGK